LEEIRQYLLRTASLPHPTPHEPSHDAASERAQTHTDSTFSTRSRVASDYVILYQFSISIKVSFHRWVPVADRGSAVVQWESVDDHGSNAHLY